MNQHQALAERRQLHPGLPQPEHHQQVQGGDPYPLLRPGEKHLECRVQCWPSFIKGNVYQLKDKGGFSLYKRPVTGVIYIIFIIGIYCSIELYIIMKCLFDLQAFLGPLLARHTWGHKVPTLSENFKCKNSCVSLTGLFFLECCL